eukprot:6870978-Pyramimonas_sp.AAC.1
MSDGGRCAPRPLALARTGRTPAVRARGGCGPGCVAAGNSSGPGCVAAAEQERSSHHYHSRAL